MSETPAKDTHARALAINLDASIFGSFAEIGGGQEVARWSFTVGAASGTVAQTISAYDKAFSDDTYGAGTRYVSRERLLAMLDREYKLLVDRLGPTRGTQSRFFAFADTVATRNFKGDNEQHGWMGLRFQSDPGAEPTDLLLHANLMASTATDQQEALGVLGVNLLYAAHHARESAEAFLDCLWGGLSIDLLEIDVLHFSGPTFGGSDPRTWCLQLLRRKMTHGIVFDTSAQVVEPSALLRKRPLIVDRGRFETVDAFHGEMLASAQHALRNEGIPLAREPQSLLEITLHPAGSGDAPDDSALVARIKRMLSVAPSVVTDLAEAYHFVPYLRRYTSEPIRMVVGVSLLARILQTQFYNALAGSMLEGLGKFFASNVKIYAYPMPRDAVARVLDGHGPAGNVRIADSAGSLIRADDLELTSPSSHLYRYLREGGQVIPIEPVSQ